MAQPPESQQPNDQQPSTQPRELYPVADIRFVLVELGKLGAQVERLIADVSKQGEKLDSVRLSISFVKGALWVIGTLIVLFGGLAVWYVERRIGG